jgi:hypothetical protein
MAIGAQVCRDLPATVDPPEMSVLIVYLWLFRGVVGGVVTGAGVGVGYALLRRWLAWDSTSEPRSGGSR